MEYYEKYIKYKKKYIELSNKLNSIQKGGKRKRWNCDINAKLLKNICIEKADGEYNSKQ